MTDRHARHHATIGRDRQHVRGLHLVFGTLLVLTVFTVAVSYLHLEVHEAITLALFIATSRPRLVALFFMHLISERKLIL